MKKVYQTIIDKDRGDCMRAVIASLLELPLEAIPNFIDHGDKYYSLMRRLLHMYDYNPCFMWEKDNITLKEIAKYDGGIDGYFYASVPSMTFDDRTHAVVVNQDLEIVHDPNPNQKALELNPEDVNNIITVGDWYLTKNGEFVDHKPTKD